MSKPEWGLKRTCQACSARFYDMNKNPAACPKCGKEFDPTATVKKRRGRPPLAEKRKAEAEAAKSSTKEKVGDEMDVEVDDVIEIEDSDDDLLPDDDDDLGDDDVGVSVPTTKDDD